MNGSDRGVAELLARLRGLGIEVSAEGERLLCHGARKALTREIQAELADRKREILAHLHGGDGPLSYPQQRLWFLDQMQPGTAAYTLPMAQRLVGALDLVALRRSLTEVVRRHEILRTTFPTVDGAPVQRLGAPFDVDVPVVDLRAMPAPLQSAQVDRLVREHFARPFDLARDRLLRATVLALAPDRHVLIVTVHHIVADGWSISVLVRELSALYAAFAAGMPSPLPAPLLQYAGWVALQRERLRGPVLAPHLDYWTRQLAGVPLVLDLPTDRPRPSVQTFRGGREVFDVAGSVTDRLRAVSRRAGATLFMTLLSGFGVLLARYSRQERLLLGTPIASRDHEETESLVGCLVNTLALPVDVAGDPTFVELLARVRETTLGAYDHQDVPFERLVEQVQPERDTSRNPLVQVSVGLHNAAGQAPLARVPLAGLDVTALDVDPGTARFDVEIDLWEVAGGLRGRVIYNADLFDATTIARMTTHLRALLDAIAADPDRRVSALPMLSPDERHAALVRFNPAPRPSHPERLVHELFAARAQRAPDAVALVFDGERLTYGELDRRADRLARRLRQAGVRAEAPVGLCLTRGPHAVVAMLGILKAGGAFVPLDPEHPAARVDLVLDDCGAAVLVTESALRERFAGRDVRLVCVDIDGEPADAPADLDAARPACAESLAYVMYTSGSTGRPKGVQVPHRAVVSLLDAVNDSVGVTADDVFLAVTTLAFDISVLEIFLPLLNGARLVLASRDEIVDGTRLTAAITRHAVTAMQATPATWWMLVESGWSGDRKLKVLCGGEALPSTLAAALLPRAATLWNLYGPTETTIWSAADQVKDADAITIGRPLSNTEIYVLDDALEPVAVGMAGELWVAGEGVARGYLGRPDLTGERFLPHPFSDRRGARMYRTGDLGRRLADGRIECLGRVDHQVKVRGFRVEPGEIEAALLRHEGVGQAVVVLRRHDAGDQRLVAYVVAASRPAPTAPALRQFLQALLPAYLVPADLVVVDALPTTPNGKIDRAALPAPTRATVASAAWAAPAGDVERTLATIWSEILRLERVGTRDNFFDLGGHSLLLVRVRSEIARRLGADVSVVDLFRHPTIQALADHLAPGDVAPAAADPDADATARARRQADALARLGQAAMQGRARRG